MPKRVGTEKSRRPGFDWLEHRALLSGAMGWPGGGWAAPSGPSPRAESGWFQGPGPGGPTIPFAGQPNQDFGPDSIGSESPEWGPGGFAPSQAGAGSWSSPVGPSLFLAGGAWSSASWNGPLTAVVYLQVNVAAPSSAALAPAFAGFTPAHGSAGAQPAAAGQGTSAAESGATGTNSVVVPANAKESGQDPPSVVPSQSSLGVTPPAQGSTFDANLAGRGLSLVLSSGSDGSAGGPTGVPWTTGRAGSEHATLARTHDAWPVHALIDSGDPHSDFVPEPSRADLIASVLPVDRAAVDRAIDRLFHQLDELGAGDHSRSGPARIALVSLALTGSLLALDAARRSWRRFWAGGSLAGHDSVGRCNPGGFPARPRSWSSRYL
jgi:hypothetical protein